MPAAALREQRPATELSAEVQDVLENPLVDVEGELSEWFIVEESAEYVVIMRENAQLFDPGIGDVRTHSLRAISEFAASALPLESGWGLDRATSCTPSIDLGELDRATVTLDPDAMPGDEDERITLLVTEYGCSLGVAGADRVELIELVETDTTVELVIGLRQGEAGPDICLREPTTQLTVGLEHPLGDRVILNGTVVPAREITTPTGPARD